MRIYKISTQNEYGTTLACKEVKVKSMAHALARACNEWMPSLGCKAAAKDLESGETARMPYLMVYGERVTAKRMAEFIG